MPCGNVCGMVSQGREIMNEEYDLHIMPCCSDMEEAMMMNRIRQGIIEDDTLVPAHWIVWNDGDMMPLRYCPSCGARLTKDTRGY